MRTSQAARYARWAAIAAILLTVVTAGVYVWRGWQARQNVRNAPPPVPITVQKRSETFSFSKVEGERTLFTVRASQATEFKEGGKSLLEDVWITIYGRAGKRFDNIHTGKCDYVATTGRIVCAGEVQIDLETADEAKQNPGVRAIHISTANISFDRESGEAHTESAVLFRFPYGQGRGVGVTYSTHEAVVRLHREVEMTLTQANKSAAPLTLTGGSLEYRRDNRTMRLLAPVRAQQGNRELNAGAVTLEFDVDLRAQRVVATEKPQLRSLERGSAENIFSADQFVASLGRDGSIDRILATGNVAGVSKDAAAQNRLTAQRVELEMVPGLSQPRLLTAAGDVKVFSESRGESRRMETASLRVNFAPSGRAAERRLSHGESLAPALVEWRQGDDTTRVRAERLRGDFTARNRVQKLTGNSGVEIERRIGSGPAQQIASREFVMQFGLDGGWTETEQSGNVRFREGTRSAQAERAKMVRATDTISLSGSSTVADPLTRTSANTIIIHQRTGEVRADGAVRTSYLKPEQNGITNLAAQPAHISADQLRANSSSGRALYSGHARLWQGDSVIEGDSIEMIRDEKRLDARGNVRAIFPQAETNSPVGAGLKPAPASGKESPGERTIWRVRAGSLSYRSTESLAHLEESVQAESRIGQIQAPRIDLFLSNSVSSPGAQQLTRAAATGGVSVRQGDRRGSAERADYIVSEGKFVLSGGKPTLFDAVLGTTTGRQLTFFLADDKILVDSEEGSRTVTKHRVEK